MLKLLLLLKIYRYGVIKRLIQVIVVVLILAVLLLLFMMMEVSENREGEVLGEILETEIDGEGNDAME
jgi:hypothetical protein